MNEFVEKWRTDSKFKAKVQLGFYAVFILIALIFALMSRNTISNSNNNLLIDYEEEITNIKIPEKYEYSIKINLNNIEYTYEGNKTEEKETIIKIINKERTNYIKKENKYYKNSIMINNIVKKEDVYDIIDYSYLNLNTINKYLSVSKKETDQRIVYLNDIILGYDSEEYIIIELETNKIKIDYTSLLQIFDNTIESCNVEYIIKETE